MADPDLVGLRGKERYGPRWRPHGLRLNAATRAISDGDLATAAAILAELYEATRDADGEGLDLRARVLASQANVAEARGDLAAALRHAGDSLAVCDEALRSTDDRLGTSDVRTSVLVNRAQTLQAVGRAEEALRDLDEAQRDFRVAADVNSALLPFVLHNTRGTTLMALERYAEAETEIRRALAIALEHDPRLAAHAYSNLAAIAQHTGDFPAATAHLHVAHDLREHSGTAAERLATEVNLGRDALRAGRLAEAEERLASAQQGYERAGHVIEVAECQVSRAVVAQLQGRAPAAGVLLDDAIAALTAAGEVPTLIECYLARAHVTAATTGDMYQTDEVFLRARELAVEARAWHEVARTDYLRAQLAVTAAEYAPEHRTTMYESALHLVLIAALAADGFRHRYRPGPMRERWVRFVAMPSLALALHVSAELGRGDLVFHLIEHASASVSLQAELSPDGDVREPDLLRYDAPDLTTRFTLPPRLRVLPGDEPTEFDAYLDAAESEYRLPIRGGEVVRAW